MVKPWSTLAVVLFVNVSLLCAQPVDTTEIFSQEDFLQWVLDYHPVVRRSNLLPQQAEASIREARGGFDPKLYADWNEKSFDGKNYFRIAESGLKIPSWYGLEMKGAFLSTSGEFLNPENELPASGQVVLGVKASLLRGMLIDQRRAALEQAKLMAAVNEAERRLLVNDLLIEATAAYWEWAVAYQQLNIYERALQIAQTRMEGIVESFRQGDKPAIDTLETFIQVQNRLFDLNEAIVHYRNAGLQLSNFLWYENELPLEITSQLKPQTAGGPDPAIVLPSLDAFQQQLNARHPQLLSYRFKIDRLQIDRRLAAEQLKPRLDVEYNFLSSGTDFINSPNGDASAFRDLLTENYKWGLKFSMPILLRKERGKLEQTRLKIVDSNYQLQQKQLELNNKMEQYYNELLNIQQQLDLYAETVDNYELLLEAERQKLSIGESSVFLINTREQKLIEAQLKLAKLSGNYQKIRMSLEWAAGRLGE